MELVGLHNVPILGGNRRNGQKLNIPSSCKTQMIAILLFFIIIHKTDTTKHHLIGSGMDPKFPKKMMHSPSEWQQRTTFAEGMQGSFIASDVHNTVTQVCQKRHGVRATNFKGNRYELYSTY